MCHALGPRHQPDGTFCYVFGNRGQRIYTKQPVPSDAENRAAKRFTPDDESFTLYLVRHRWGDDFGHVTVTADSRTSVATLPESFVRFRLERGRYDLVAAWNGKTTAREIQGNVGEVNFVQLVDSSWSWGTIHQWEMGHEDATRRLAVTSRLIADVVVRSPIDAWLIVSAGRRRLPNVLL